MSLIKKYRVYRFRKLRESVKVFLVQKTDGLFGKFYSVNRRLDVYRVVARNPHEAVERLHKRGVALHLSLSNTHTLERWAHFKVREEGKPDAYCHNYYY